ncbi:MAG: ankyrin repeat domain-containing protein [Candidatus Hydrogenedentes bacterium]|nr:ankyrin repeat domain-containing protein [Candidatus Hydrogenedentota bacterium]
MKTWTDEAKAYTDRYLRQVRVLLEGGGADAHEVVEDLQRHIHEQAQNAPQVVITIDDAKRVVAGMGSPEEVAFSWRQLGADAGRDPWVEPTTPVPIPQSNRNVAVWKILATAILAAIIAFPVALFVGYFAWNRTQTVAIPAKETPVDHKTALHAASAGGHLEEVTRLLAAGADPNARDSGGMTPLHYAAQNGHNGTAQTLMQHGADSTIRDLAGKTPADLAREQRHEETLAVITGEPAEKLQPGMYTKEFIASHDVAYFINRIGNPEAGYHDFAGMWAVILKANEATSTARDKIIADALNIAADISRPFAQRYQCVYIASQFGDPRVVPNLAQLLYRDADPKLRGVVACALGQIGGPQAKEVLQYAQQNEPDQEAQSWIARALAGEFKQPKLPEYGLGPRR